MNAPANLKYTKSDEWFDPASGAMGISDYAQSQLSDIVFVELLVDEGDSIEAAQVNGLALLPAGPLQAGHSLVDQDALRAGDDEHLRQDHGRVGQEVGHLRGLRDGHVDC